MGRERALDEELAQKKAAIAEAEARAMGLIFVSHSPALAFRLATRVVELPAVPGAVRG